LAVANITSLINRAENNPNFQKLASGNAYTLDAAGIQSGTTCSPFLMLVDTEGAYIQVIFNPDDSVGRMIYNPPSNASFTGSNYAWAGYETYRCPSTCGKVTLASTQVDFTVPSFKQPTSYNNTNCCMDGLWTGLGDKSGASDSVLTQGGVAVYGDYQLVSGYSSPTFFYEQLNNGGVKYWTSTCLVLNSGDTVNVTIQYGSFSYGGNSFDIKQVFGDNDASSTCAVAIFMNYSITPTYAYYIYEAAQSIGCTYPSGRPGYCQTIQFSSLTYDAYVHYPGAGWDGYAATPSGSYSGDTQYTANWYISQGRTDVDIDCCNVYSTSFQIDWVSSQQI
jgi:hypothetical protein